VILERLILLAPAVAALAIVLSLSVSDTAYSSFQPELTVEIADPTAEATSDWVLEFGLPTGDVNFAGAVDFIPQEWGVVDGRDIPVGAEVGLQRADATLGLIGSPCNQPLPIVFEMQNASLDQSDTVSFEDLDKSGTEDFAEDNDDNGIIDGIDHWPEFIFRTLEDTEEDPIRRAAGMAIISGTPVLLQFLIFPPGTFINENISNDESLGYPTVILLQDIGDPEIVPAPGPITDFCTPLTANNRSFGVTQDNEVTPDVDESGYPLFANPQDGTYTFTVASAGQRDADGDSYENSLDTCPLVVNVGNPRIANDGDLDSDGLDAACDPNDDPATGGTDSDEDADGYLNRQDNCPLVANGEETTNQADDDEDGVGDVCDPDPNDATAQGEISLDETIFEVTIGAGGAGGPPDCSGLTAADGGSVSCWTAGDTPDDGDNGQTRSGDDDGGSDTGLIIGIIAVVIAAIGAIGGGAAFMMRRGNGA